MRQVDKAVKVCLFQIKIHETGKVHSSSEFHVYFINITHVSTIFSITKIFFYFQHEKISFHKRKKL